MSPDLSVATGIIEDLYNPDCIVNALWQLASFDADFSGDNGAEYTSEEALAAGFDSDAAYRANYYVQQYIGSDPAATLPNIIKDYLDDWMGHNCYYATFDYSYEIIGNSAVVFLAAVHEG